MENTELTVLALALFVTTLNIYVYSWFQDRARYLRAGLWVMRVTGILPGLAVTVWAVYVRATSTESVLGTTLLTAGLLLVAGGLQFLSMLQRKLENGAATAD